MSEVAWVLLGPEGLGWRYIPRFLGIADSTRYPRLFFATLLLFVFESLCALTSRLFDPEEFSDFDDWERRL